MHNLEHNVNQFLGFIADCLVDIKNGTFGNSNNIFKKFLYVGILDALSKTVSYPKQSNQDRFLALIENYAKWKYADKISLPHLVRLLEKVHSKDFAQVREYAHQQFDKWIPGLILELDHDPDSKVIQKLWPPTIPKPLEGVDLDSIRHLRLFYRYRNSLVHELRELGYASEFKNGVEPYYLSHHNPEFKNVTWDLVYPTGFYEKLCNNVLTSLREYYLKDRIDPYTCFTFGSYWLDELNR